MAFRINTGPLALRALGNVSSVSNSLATSMQRLGSGLKVGRSGDDPAAFVGVSRMRDSAQSLDTSIRITQENTNYMKTAEGALDEISRLLRDARSLALNSLNQPTLTSSQRDANNQQLKSISDSITRIANNTSYGSNRILNGASGLYAGTSDMDEVGKMSFTGMFGGYAITSTAAVTIDVVTTATLASMGLTVSAGLSCLVGAGSFSINGTSFSVGAGDSFEDVFRKINSVSDLTGVYVSYSVGGGGGACLIATEWGADHKIEVLDPDTLISSATFTSAIGRDAVAVVTVAYDGENHVGVTFDRGNGRTLVDEDGNTIELTASGATGGLAAAATGGRVLVPVGGPTRFQVGINNTTQDRVGLSMENVQSDNLGVDGSDTLKSVDLISSANASTALNVIDKAIDQVTAFRGRVGNFQKNVLDVNMRSLSIGKENMMASISAIADTDMAEEAAAFAKHQILSESAISVLGQASNISRSVISLLR